MNGFRFVPLDRCEVVPAQVESLVGLLHDAPRMAPARTRSSSSARRRGPTRRSITSSATRSSADCSESACELDDLTQERLFELLNVHEHTRAAEVGVSEEAAGRAVVLDAGGALAGAWAPAYPDTAAEPPPPVMRNGGDAPPPPPSAPAPPAPPPSFAPPPPPLAANGGSDDDRRGDEEPSVDAFFRRTPHLELSEEEPLAVGRALTAAVFLDTEAAQPGETVQEVVIDLPDDLEVLEIDVLLAATEHFAVRNECMKTLSMHRDDARSPELTFDLEVVSTEPAGVAPALTAFLTYQHRPCGRVHRTVRVARSASRSTGAAGDRGGR